MIPKILHFIWLGENEPPTVRFTIDTFARVNPDFKINFIREKDPLNPVNEDVKEVLKLITSTTPNKWRSYFHNSKLERGNRKSTSVFYTTYFLTRFSDVLRWYLLSKYGGIYIDCDIFPVKPFDDLLLNKYEFFMSGVKNIKRKSYISDIGMCGYDKDTNKSNVLFFNLYNKLPRRVYNEVINNSKQIMRIGVLPIDYNHGEDDPNIYKKLLKKYQTLSLEYGKDFFIINTNDSNTESTYVNLYSRNCKYSHWIKDERKYMANPNSYSINPPILSNKIIIFTCFCNQTNYGQRLQTYALEKTIRDFGKDCRTINFCRKAQRNDRDFGEFEDKYMHILDITNSLQPLYDFSPTIAIIGGDQVLNVNWTKLFTVQNNIVSKIPYLITYGSSDGGNTLETYKNRNVVSKTLDILKLSSGISVREKTTAEYLKKSLNRTDIRCDIDPVLLLTKDEWKSISKKPDRIKEDEVFDFSYIVNKQKNKVENNNGINHYFQYGNTWKQDDSFTPNEFLWMIEHCRNFYTNSYHGFLFSILFNKKVNITKWKQTDRFKNSALDIKDFSNIDFEDVNKQIEEHRKSSIEYLKEKV